MEMRHILVGVELYLYEFELDQATGEDCDTGCSCGITGDALHSSFEEARE